MPYTVAFSVYRDANTSPESGALESTVANSDESHEWTAGGAGISNGQIVFCKAIVQNSLPLGVEDWVVMALEAQVSFVAGLVRTFSTEKLTSLNYRKHAAQNCMFSFAIQVCVAVRPAAFSERAFDVPSETMTGIRKV